MTEKPLSVLPGLCHHELTQEMADQLVAMLEDPNHPTFEGEDLPLADKTAILARLDDDKKRDIIKDIEAQLGIKPLIGGKTS